LRVILPSFTLERREDGPLLQRNVPPEARPATGGSRAASPVSASVAALAKIGGQPGPGALRAPLKP
jgi:hypothetical protein